jgi:hypothetical protein
VAQGILPRERERERRGWDCVREEEEVKHLLFTAPFEPACQGYNLDSL